jgi:hypothetical protein
MPSAASEQIANASNSTLTVWAAEIFMALALFDPRWNELRSNYGETNKIVAWLEQAQKEGGLSEMSLSCRKFDGNYG